MVTVSYAESPKVSESMVSKRRLTGLWPRKKTAPLSRKLEPLLPDSTLAVCNIRAQLKSFNSIRIHSFSAAKFVTRQLGLKWANLRPCENCLSGHWQVENVFLLFITKYQNQTFLDEAITSVQRKSAII